MEKSKKISMEIILNCIIAFVLAFDVLISILPNFYPSILLKVLIYGFLVLVIFITMKVQLSKRKEEGKEALRNRYVKKIGVVYCVALATVLLFGNTLRTYHFSNQVSLFSEEHFTYYSNFVPFQTIGSYFTRMMEGSINQSIPILNLAGNLLLFAPMGFFMPYLWKERVGKFVPFVLTILGIICLVEVIQFITMKGQADIDDVILNLSGAVILYGVYHIPFVHKTIQWILK